MSKPKRILRVALLTISGVLVVSYGVAVLVCSSGAESSYSNGTVAVDVRPQDSRWLLTTTELEFDVTNVSNVEVQIVVPRVDSSLTTQWSGSSRLINKNCQDTDQCLVDRGWFVSLAPGEKKSYRVPLVDIVDHSKVSIGSGDVTIIYSEDSMNSAAELIGWNERSTMGGLENDGYRIHKSLIGTLRIEKSRKLVTRRAKKFLQFDHVAIDCDSLIAARQFGVGCEL